jgi:hypothetical protein
LYKNAKELNSIFQGGIFHMKYGQKDNEVLSCQKELIRTLQLNPQEVSIQDYFACIPTFYCHECGWGIVMKYLLGYVKHMCICITNIYKRSFVIQTKLKKGSTCVARFPLIKLLNTNNMEDMNIMQLF